MCKNLVEKGDLDKPLIIFNRTTKRATDLQAKLPKGKSTVVEELGEGVAKADIIFTCLGDDKAITDTISTAMKGDVKGKLFVDCSTVHPDTTDKLAKTVEEHGAHFVACPGSPSIMGCIWSAADDGSIQFLALQPWPREASSYVCSQARNPWLIK